MNTLRMVHDGFFEGQFLMTTDRCASSLGTEVRVRRTGPPFDSGEKFDLPSGRVVHCWLLPVEIMRPGNLTSANIAISTGVTGQHWNECLKEGVPSVVKACKFRLHDYTGYVANIDGWVPGLFGKCKAATSRYQEVEA